MLKLLSCIYLLCGLVLGLVITITGCDGDNEDKVIYSRGREDNAYKLAFSINGSLQNPAWSPDGNSILFTRFRNGYDGAPSWSPDGTRIAFESYPGDPDYSSGTTLWIVDVPKL